MNPAAFGVKREPLGILTEMGGAKIAEPSPRTQLYTTGSPSKGLYFLELGLVVLHSSTREHEDFVYEVLVPGSVFGEECLSSSGLYFSNATAVTAGSLWSIPVEKLKEQFGSHSPTCQWVLDSLAQRRNRQNRRIWTMCSQSVQHRILDTILDLSSYFPGTGGLEADLPVSQSTMARIVCSTRETVSSQLNRFADSGLLHLETRHIGVPSIDALLEAIRRIEYK